MENETAENGVMPCFQSARCIPKFERDEGQNHLESKGSAEGVDLWVASPEETTND